MNVDASATATGGNSLADYGAFLASLSSHPQYWFSIGSHSATETLHRQQSSAATPQADGATPLTLQDAGFDVDRIAARLRQADGTTSSPINKQGKKQGLPLFDRAVDEAIAQLPALSTGHDQDDPDVPQPDPSAIDADTALQGILSF